MMSSPSKRRIGVAFPYIVVLLAFNGCASFAQAPGGQRAGLGTSWGESRESRVRSVPFERADGPRPAAVAVLHYDDGLGVRLLANEDGFASAPCDRETGQPGLFTLRLVDEHGVSLPRSCRGERTFVEGRLGQRYFIEIKNQAATRFEVVATVDGLDVIDGNFGSFAKRGYVIEPLDTVRIEGFRRSAATVAAFRFGAIGESYAARKGNEANVGVVAVALFAERPWYPPGRLHEADVRRRADPFPGQR